MVAAGVALVGEVALTARAIESKRKDLMSKNHTLHLAQELLTRTVTALVAVYQALRGGVPVTNSK